MAIRTQCHYILGGRIAGFIRFGQWIQMMRFDYFTVEVKSAYDTCEIVARFGVYHMFYASSSIYSVFALNHILKHRIFLGIFIVSRRKIGIYNGNVYISYPFKQVFYFNC